jgi:ParB-like chromosome segregation protein Spo0J
VTAVADTSGQLSWPVHPAAELFPLLSGQALADLAADIAEQGLREPVVLTPAGELLDGRNRVRACAIAGVTPTTRTESSEPWAYVISTNVHRRHLSEAQRAMIGARIAERTKGQYERANGPAGPFAPDSPDPPPPTTDEAAQLLNVGTRSIKRARRVISHGSPDLQKAADEGKVPMRSAERVALTMNAEEQDSYVAAVNAGTDPRRAAPERPATPKASAPPRPPTSDRSYYKRSEVMPRSAIVGLISTISGLATGLADIKAIDGKRTATAVRKSWQGWARTAHPRTPRVHQLLIVRNECD